MEKVNLAEKFARFSEQWKPKIVGEVDDYDVKLVKVEGEFVWHSHPEEDELFLVVDGRLTIHFRDRDVELSSGEFLVVPKGVEHKPSALVGMQPQLRQIPPRCSRSTSATLPPSCAARIAAT